MEGWVVDSVGTEGEDIKPVTRKQQAQPGASNVPCMNEGEMAGAAASHML